MMLISSTRGSTTALIAGLLAGRLAGDSAELGPAAGKL
jgi:hypothetical protein